MVIGGHTRLEAAQSLGLDKVPVRYMDLDPADAKLLALADNRLQDLGVYDDEALTRVIRALAEEGADLGVAGYSDIDLDGILGRNDHTDVPDAPPPPIPPKPKSGTGEVYELGPHRLICADSTEGAIEVVMGDDKADAVWTDPPYGVTYRGGPMAEIKGKPRDSIKNDSLGNDALLALLRSSFGDAINCSAPGAAWYVAAPAGPQFAQFAEALGDLGIWRHTLVWACLLYTSPSPRDS